jgi:sarcosine oxidase
MPQRYDVIVAGLGVMGSSVALHAARRGLRVLGLDRFAPPHTMGSSHGNTRLIREAYYEHPLYVPLVRRSYELLCELEQDLGQALVTRTGSLMLGHPRSELVQGTIRSVVEHAVPHRVMSAEEVHREFPGLEPSDDFVGVYEPGSSLLNPEMIVAGQLTLAAMAGAELLYNEPVVSWKTDDSGVRVSTSVADYRCRQLVLAAGAWNARLAPEAFGMLRVERQLQQWWVPAKSPEWFGAGNLPVSMWQLPDARIFYTMPDTGLGLKLGWHHSGAIVDPDTVGREAEPAENAELADLLRRFLPAAKGARRASAACLYTNTPDGHFVIDRHPEESNVWLLSPCSGHGFKFAGVLGEVVAALLTDTPPGFDLSPFQLGRFRQ